MPPKPFVVAERQARRVPGAAAPPTMGAMRDVACDRQEDRDERELARLDLVGLACEVATLADRIAEAVRDSAAPRAIESAGRLDSLSRHSQELLAPQTDFASFSDATLEHALAELRKDQQEMLQLREEVERILAGWSVIDPTAAP